jgi:hypothetical protein
MLSLLFKSAILYVPFSDNSTMSQHSDLPEMAFCVATLKILIECASDAHHTALYVVRVRDSNDLCMCV